MQPWVFRSLERWPNVPALFGWLSLDRRGRWLIRGELITHERIVETINLNYSVDEHGRWFFQNGPQRGYMELAYAPFVLHRVDGGVWMTHNGLLVERPTQAFIDESGTVSLTTEHGFAEVAGTDLAWLLERMSIRERAIADDDLAHILELPSGAATDVVLDLGSARLPIMRLDAAAQPSLMNFSRVPQPREGERAGGANAPD